jgi:hypothetical protein
MSIGSVAGKWGGVSCRVMGEMGGVACIEQGSVQLQVSCAVLSSLSCFRCGNCAACVQECWLCENCLSRRNAMNYLGKSLLNVTNIKMSLC